MPLNRALLLETLCTLELRFPDDALARLDRYADLLAETNRQFNLTAVTEPDEVTIKHFADCLSLFAYVEIPQNASVIDVGTGAGFPGLVLKLVRPDLSVTFLDSTKKKLGFIENVLAAVSLTGETVHARAEEAGQDAQFRERFDFATARAVAALPVLSEYCLPFVKQGGTFLAMKSAAADAEIDKARGAIRLLGGQVESDFLFDLAKNMPRRIVTVRKISQTPPKYPRPSAKIAKNPLK